MKKIMITILSLYGIITCAETKDVVKVQNMLVDMAIMMGTQTAANEANTLWASQQDAVFFDVLSQASSNVQVDFSTFQNTIGSAESDSLSGVINNFTNVASDISTDKSQATADATAESDYLLEMTSLDLPQTNYLFDAPTFDVLFNNSKMYVPDGITWYNTNQVGDWEYDPNTQSFWQYEVVDSSQTGSDGTASTATAANNNIFTEFFTGESSYDIECDITVFSVSYPFYAGIIFNNNRWISGDMSGLRRYRTVGIYGADENNIGVYYAEQYVDASADANATDVSEMTGSIKAPLDQIFDGTAQKLDSLDASSFADLADKEASYTFAINNSSGAITVTFGAADGSSSTRATVTPQDPSIFLYHGVGFTSPGAVAQYNLKGPDVVLFSSDAITAFQEEVSTAASSSS